MQLKEIKNIFHKELGSLYPPEEVNSFFYLLIEHYLGMERFVLALQPNLTVSKDEEQPLFEALSQLRLGRPIQYVIGQADFMDLEFLVNDKVLIPRPETEELVRWILDDVNDGRGKGGVGELKILDIGTGSGCIAVALAKNLPKAEVHALDVSGLALEVARKNAVRNAVDIQFLEVDILKGPELPDAFDVIVSNPPYVREKEKAEMHANVLDNEPDMALFVSDGDPLLFYRAIARFSKGGLKKEGRLYLEINQYLGKETQELLKEHNFSEIELRKDMFENDRMIRACF
ncbi:peptide chain release factor N(5)-glutamine methyltransferase [Pseudozobellia thermophila]|uniref:Release factor glutamine methyltransferase n=1 Tax=Pseudozobellia thermophila TaxID=192903 RepID=A0A1M6FAS8_9FLAO|nr:peptide chain release factor N(5)-glutamine methyltransferase [Pseudozobellia thermophila]SHI94756.1 release factor glutamine methyltransferase [Pseudozobellia thermophila]